MFGTIRRHQTWLWVIIITLTVISFVFFFSPDAKYSGRNDGQRRTGLGTMRGKEITPAQFLSAKSEIFIHYFLTHNEWPDKDPTSKQMGFDADRETYFRLFLIQQQEDRKIKVSDKAVNQTLYNILQGGREKPIQVDDFERNVLKPRGLTKLDLENFLRHDAGNQQLIATLGMPGKLVTPQEAESLFRHENEEMVCEVANFTASNFLSQVTVSSNGIALFHQQHQAEYRIPDRVQVNYVRYDVTNFFAEADEQITKTITNMTEFLESVYNKRGGTNFYKELKPDEAKVKIKEEVRHNTALSFAVKKAAEFADPLLSVEGLKPEFISQVAATNKVTVKTTSPFTQSESPKEIKVSPRFNRAAFALTRETPFAGPLDEEDAVYVIGLNKNIPSENPPLDSIRDRVTVDYKFVEALNLARQAAGGLARGFSSNALAVADFPTAAAAFKAEYIKAPRFSLTTRKLPEIDDRLRLGQLQQAAFATPTGKASEVVYTENGAFVMHVIDRIPVTAETMKRELPGFTNFLRQTRQNEAFNEWFRVEATRELADVEALKPKNSGAAPR